eukprot:1192209-Amphidinium_carterae.1
MAWSTSVQRVFALWAEHVGVIWFAAHAFLMSSLWCALPESSATSWRSLRTQSDICKILELDCSSSCRLHFMRSYSMSYFEDV